MVQLVQLLPANHNLRHLYLGEWQWYWSFWFFVPCLSLFVVLSRVVAIVVWLSWLLFLIMLCCFQGFRSSPSAVNLAAAAAALVVRQVEAKYPALLFKQQLTAYVEKIYGIIRDNLKKELGSLISLCIQVCRNILSAIHYCSCKSFLLFFFGLPLPQV